MIRLKNLKNLKNLTSRQQEILKLVTQGYQNKEIATTLGISIHTVEQHIKAIYNKLGVANRAEASALYSKQIYTDKPSIIRYHKGALARKLLTIIIGDEVSNEAPGI